MIANQIKKFEYLHIPEWNVPEFKVNVKKGLHFYGKLKLKTGEIYDTTVSGLDSMQWRATFHLEPLRYGKITKDSRGRPIFQHVNLFLHKNSTSTVIGPDFVLEGQTRYLKGYITLFLNALLTVLFVALVTNIV